MLGDARQRSGAVLLAWVWVMGVTTLASGQAPPGSVRILPPAVARAFQQAYPTATIAAASQVKDGDRTAFRIESLDNGRQRVVLYAPNGATIEVAQPVEEKDLPQPVSAAMHSHPRAIYVTGTKVTRGTRVQYRLTLRGTRKTAMVVNADGTVVSFQ